MEYSLAYMQNSIDCSHCGRSAFCYVSRNHTHSGLLSGNQKRAKLPYSSRRFHPGHLLYHDTWMSPRKTETPCRMFCNMPSKLNRKSLRLFVTIVCKKRKGQVTNVNVSRWTFLTSFTLIWQRRRVRLATTVLHMWNRLTLLENWIIRSYLMFSEHFCTKTPCRFMETIVMVNRSAARSKIAAVPMITLLRLTGMFLARARNLASG